MILAGEPLSTNGTVKRGKLKVETRPMSRAAARRWESTEARRLPQKSPWQESGSQQGTEWRLEVVISGMDSCAGVALGCRVSPLGPRTHEGLLPTTREYGSGEENTCRVASSRIIARTGAESS